MCTPLADLWLAEVLVTFSGGEHGIGSAPHRVVLKERHVAVGERDDDVCSWAGS
jgi:hypothetical protein